MNYWRQPNGQKTQTPRADCRDDLNGDGQAECILANQKYFAVLEPAGARLTQFFYIDGNGPHQVVGPSSQFAVGLSDPSEWHPESGEAADPSVIPGAFADDTDTWTNYSSTITADGITFTDPDGSRVKTYRLTGEWHPGTLSNQQSREHPYPAGPGSSSILFRSNKLSGRPRPAFVDLESVRWEQCRGPHGRTSFCRGVYLRNPVPFLAMKIPTWIIRREIISPSRCQWFPSRVMELLARRLSKNDELHNRNVYGKVCKITAFGSKP